MQPKSCRGFLPESVPSGLPQRHLTQDQPVTNGGTPRWPAEGFGSPRVFNRPALCERLWAEPIRTVTSSFNVSEIVMGTARRTAGIPVPSRGHWAKHHTPPPIGDTTPGPHSICKSDFRTART